MSQATKDKFELDQFQKDSIEHMKKGASVITCAPTGAGKTVIAKEAINLAIQEGKKVFYTAPLKALINQKFHEFKETYGEENVGIITGDTNQNRDAKVIVMTTEIYRNMLYGTTFGSIDPFLKDLKFIIFDEFHFINDRGRGTVWEESVIYTPKSVQIVALSATINNPEDLVEWIEEIHGDCKLVQTFDRPVPLFHYYFKEDNLSPLLTPNGKLNPKLKERNDSRFGKRKGRFGNRYGGGGNAKSSISKVVEELFKKQILPAIYFVFSRKGCDSAAKECENLDLLSKDEITELNKLIDEAIAFNENIGKYNQINLLRKGIAAHHAGLLPQIKSLIEELFAKSLIKVVFSTETLAAGINMPAKTTVINNLSKATDEGFRTLLSSEFMQMSGRAGRRGLDESGYVVTVKNGNYSAGEVAHLATSKPEDVQSHFVSSYEMVLNLLQGHEYYEVKELIQKSFGQYLAEGKLRGDQGKLNKLEEQVSELDREIDPTELASLEEYKEIASRLDNARKEKKQLEKKLDPRVSEYEDMIEMLNFELQNHPSHGVDKQKFAKKMDQHKRYRKQVRKLEEKINLVKNYSWENFEKVADILMEEKYIDPEHNPTEIGKTCASFRTDNSLYISELIRGGVFSDLEPKEFAGLASCFVIGESRARDKAHANVSRAVSSKERKFKNIARQVIQKQRKYGINRPVEMNLNLSNVVEEWATGIAWDDLMENIMLDDGDVLRAIRRTLDLCKQISGAPNLDKKIQETAKEAVRLIERDLVIDTI